MAAEHVFSRQVVGDVSLEKLRQEEKDKELNIVMGTVGD